MKKSRYWLILAVELSAILVVCTGVIVKYGYLRPLNLFQDKSALSLPFMLLADGGMRREIEEAKNPTQPQDTTQSQNPTTEGTTTQEATQGTTDGTTTVDTIPSGTTPDTTPSQTQPDTTTQPQTKPTTPSTEPSKPTPTTPPTEPSKPTTEPIISAHGCRFSGPWVSTSWFDDALYIGDSRTVGLRDCARQGKADYFCDVGMSVFNVWDKKLSDYGFSSMSLTTLLATKSYGKVFISLGLNEAGYDMGTLISRYKTLVDRVREAQPNAVVIVQAIMMCGKQKAQEQSCFSISHLSAINSRLQALSDGVSIFYIDVNPAFTDAEGYLAKEYSSDGCHLYGKYDVEWADWISHAVANIPVS